VRVRRDPAERRAIGLDVLVRPLPDPLAVFGIVRELLAVGDPAAQDRFLR
jgi:hypothetical protein